MLFDDLTCSGSEFRRIGTATEKAQVPAWVLTLGTENKWKPDEWTTLGLDARESMENRYEGSPEERVWKWCQIEQGPNEVISGMEQNEKTEEIVWQS